LISFIEEATASAITTQGRTLGAVARSLDVRLVAGIFDFPLTEQEQVTQVFPYSQKYSIGARRLYISHSMLRTPSGKMVSGPYIGILAVDRNNEIVRAMLHPVWYHGNAVGLPRSELERQILQQLRDSGIVAFTPTHKHQYISWQQVLGSRWTGNITKIPFLGDFLCPPPNLKLLVSLLEVFGVQRITRYTDRTGIKLEVGANLELDGAVRFVPYVIHRNSHREVTLREAVRHLQWAFDDGREAVHSGVFFQWAEANKAA
jgi:hypothetical protein